MAKQNKEAYMPVIDILELKNVISELSKIRNPDFLRAVIREMASLLNWDMEEYNTPTKEDFKKCVEDKLAILKVVSAYFSVSEEDETRAKGILYSISCAIHRFRNW